MAWIVPTYKNGRPLWRLIEAAVGPLKKLGLVRVNRSERTVEFPNTGGLLAIYSMDNPDSIRGEAFHLAIVDEAAMIGEEAWTDCIQPTLADYDGDAILISTPKGRNWFWKEFQRGLTDMADGGTQCAAFTAPTSDNPSPNIQKAARLAKERVPENTYRQEWRAEFLEDGGTVFRGVGKVKSPKRPKPYAGTFVMGLDWGKENDFTSVWVQDALTGEQVDHDRFNQVGWSVQRGRVVTMFLKWMPLIILAEENSIGGPNIEALQDEGLPILGFNTNTATKGRLIVSYVLSIERREVSIFDEQVIVSELEGYESAKSKTTGRMVYGVQPGHDDTVISGALADWARVHLKELLAAMAGEQFVPDDTEERFI